ncbi:MAG: PilZ domain-containing protein [Desulfobacterales bacterium]|nr:MAG: PilZ domain-containing protein [Desulfobacterales bacterium]
MTAIKSELRVFPRYPVPEDEFFIFSRRSSAMAAIKNLSRGGLQFEYASVACHEEEWNRVDIFVRRHSQFCIAAIDCGLIYNIDNLAENRTFSGSPTRLCGLQFLRLKKEQERKLEFLLDYEIANLAGDPACREPWR